MSTNLDGSQCAAAADLGAKDACILAQIGRILKAGGGGKTTDAASFDLFASADQIDTSTPISPSPTWSYAGVTTAACNGATSTWLGVQCGQVAGTGPYRITSVNLQSVGQRGFKPFSGTIPTMFAMLTALTYLNLAFNKLSGELPVYTGGAPADSAYIPVAFQGKKILAVPTSLQTFNVSGNKLGVDITQPLTVDVITNLVAMRTGATPPYALSYVDISSNCLQGGSLPTEFSQITIGATGVFRAFNLSGNSGKDGKSPLCGANSNNPNCDGSFNNKFACADNYFVDFGGQGKIAGVDASGNTAEQATLVFNAPLDKSATITAFGLTFKASSTKGATAEQVAGAFGGLTDGKKGSDFNTAKSLTDTDFGKFDPDTATMTGYNTAPASGTTVVATSTQTGGGDVTDFTATGTGAIPAKVTIVQGVDGAAEKAVVTFAALSKGQSVTVAGLTYTAGPTDVIAADVAKAYQSLIPLLPVARAKGIFTGALTGYTTSALSGTSDITFTATTAGVDQTSPTLNPATIPGVTVGTAGTADNIDGTAGVGESTKLTFKDLADTKTVIIDGLTFTAKGTVLAADLAKLWANIPMGALAADLNTQKGLVTGAGTAPGAFSGTFGNNYNSGPADGAAVTFYWGAGAQGTAAGAILGATGDTPPDAGVRSTAKAQATETVKLTFDVGASKIVKGAVFSIAGLTFTVKADADPATGTAVAAMWDGLQPGMTFTQANAQRSTAEKTAAGTFTAGVFGQWTTSAAAAVVTFTSSAIGVDRPDAETAPAASSGATVPTRVLTNGVVPVTETATVVFQNTAELKAADTLTIAGLIFTVGAKKATAQQLASAYSKVDVGTTGAAVVTAKTLNDDTGGITSGTLTGWNTGDVTNGNTVVFTSATKGSVADITYGATLSGGYAPVSVTIQNGAKATAEKSTLTFSTDTQALQPGQSVTIAGLTYTAKPGKTITGAALIAAFKDLKDQATVGNDASLTDGFWTGKLDGYNLVAATASTLTATATNLGNLPDLDSTVAAPTGNPPVTTAVPVIFDKTGGTAHVQGANELNVETQVVTFSDIAAGEATKEVPLGGLVYVVGPQGSTAAEQAAAFANLKPQTSEALAKPATGSWKAGGVLVWTTSAVAAGNTVTFTYSREGRPLTGGDALTKTGTGAAATTIDTATSPGKYPVTESWTVTFKDIPANGFVTLGGLTYTAGASLVAAADVATAWQNLGAGVTAAQANSQKTLTVAPWFTGGTLAKWGTTTKTGAAVDFISSTVGENVADLTLEAGTANAPVAKATAAAGVTEMDIVTFGAAGGAAQAVTVGGLTITGATGVTLTAANLGLAFSSLQPGAQIGPAVQYGQYSGQLSGWSTTAVDGTGTKVTFTASSAAINPDDADATTQGSTTLTDKTKAPKVTSTIKNGANLPKTETTVATFGNFPTAGARITIAGLVFKVGTTPGASNAASIAEAFRNLPAGTSAASANTIKGAAVNAATFGNFETGVLTGYSTYGTATETTTTFVSTTGNPGKDVDDLFAFGQGYSTTGAPVTAAVGTQGTNGPYPYALVCGSKNDQFVNYFMYEACVLNQIRNSLDAGVGSPAAQNNTALKTWIGDRACPSKNAVPWFGVTCDSNDRVIGVNLTAQKITGTVPIDFFFLQNLKTLDLSVNRIGGTLPIGTYNKWTSALSTYTATTISLVPTALETLDISDNRISGGIDATAGAALGAAIRKKVDLSNNCLRGTLPTVLQSNVPSTIAFDLNGNRGRTGTADEILCQGGIQNTVLAVCNNKFNNELACRDYANVPACDGILWDTYQGFEACTLKKIGAALGADLTALRWVGNSACPPGANPWVGITCDSQLNPVPVPVRDRVVKVDLSGRGLTGTLPFEFYYLSALEELNLANNRITGTLQTQQVTINGATVIAPPFPATIKRVFLQGNAIGGPINASIPAFFQLGAQTGGALSLTDFNLTNNCFTGPLSSNFDAFIPKVTRVGLNGNAGLCTGITTATTVAVCDSSTANAFACAGYPAPATPTTLPAFFQDIQARFALNPDLLRDPAVQAQLLAEVAGKMGIPVANLQIIAGYIYDTTTGAIIARLFAKKANTQELQTVVVFRVFAANAAAAQNAINNLIANGAGGTFPVVPGSVSTTVPTTPVTPTAPRAPIAVTPTAPSAPFAPFAPAKGSGDDDGWKIGVGVGVGVGGFLLLVIIICIVVFCLKKKAAPLPQEIDYNKVAVVQQGVPGAYPMGAYPVGAYPVYPQAAYAVSAPPPTPAYTYAVAA